MADNEDTNKECLFKPKFKAKNKRSKNLRTSIKTEDSDEDVEKVSCRLEDLKEIQNLRKRPHGVSLIGLALGENKTNNDENNSTTEKVGGMVNMNALKSGKVKQADDAYDTGIGTQFSVETNKRDEDEEMMKYIEQELSKHKGKNDKVEKNVTKNEKSYLTPEEAALQAVPSHLRESTAKRSEEMLSNQMLSGIPEVDLGIEAKIKNIEATEEAKLRLLWENQKKKDCPSQFVPTNMAVNFVQHSRFNVEQTERKMPKIDTPSDEKSKKKTDKATDDYHFERFKKQFRR